jgi:hypothetical protein
VNIYPYWEGTSIDRAVASLENSYDAVVRAANGKQVIIAETGWPSDGDVIGAAAPSLRNANAYFRDFVGWANSRGIVYFYFEAMNEPWKSKVEGPQGEHWGVWNQDGRLKEGMLQTFRGPEIPGGPGTPTVEFTYAPPLGSTDDLVGQVLHVPPAEFRIAVYIEVNGRWWTKPTLSNNITAIRSDGVFTTDITTGGLDTSATTIAAFLVPQSYNPPATLNSPTLPDELWNKAVAWVEATRLR